MECMREEVTKNPDWEYYLDGDRHAIMRKPKEVNA